MKALERNSQMVPVLHGAKVIGMQQKPQCDDKRYKRDEVDIVSVFSLTGGLLGDNPS